MKVGILTFHASHNYGSMLQAYALQNVISQLGYDCEIINFRTIRQRRCFKPFWREYHKIDMLKTLVRLPRISYDAYIKYRLFEKFLKDDLKLSTVEYKSYSDLETGAQGYYAYVSGSDQIWNVSCYDWDKAYGLGFVKNGRRIAYAPSMGPIPEQEVVTRTDNMNLLGEYLTKYDAISVREPKAAHIVKNLTGQNAQLTLDPTLLLTSSDWLKLDSRDALIKGDYILLYSPWQNEALYQEAIAIGEKFKTKIVVTLPYDYSHYRNNPNIIFKIATGPKEFLNLIRHARLVIGASFHAAAFAVIFKRQLYAYNGMEDSRVLSLLSLTGLEQFAEKPKHFFTARDLNQIYTVVDSKMAIAIKSSHKFLIEALKS